MEDTLRFVIGLIANVNALLLYSAPVLTFVRVIKNGSTEMFSCVPYILALMNCLLYTWYGSPFVSYKLENVWVVTINGLGILLEISFIVIYIWFASTRDKIKVAAMTTSVFLAFGITVVTSILAFKHGHRKILVGTVGLFASAAMYGSPLVAVRQVIKTKNVEYMPFYLSLFSLNASALWAIYGLLGKDLVLASPNLVGLPLGILQLAVYFKYRNSGIKEQPEQQC